MSEFVEDRISNLPTPILHHILSFGDTRDAARTSVLSKRWKYVWRSISILEFRCRNSSQADSLGDFIDTALELHDESNIQRFSLKTEVLSNESRIGKWITTLLSHNVEDLVLLLNQREPVLLPPSLYTCESLVALMLVLSPDIRIPKHVSFPRLERFFFIGVIFQDEFWNDQLFSNCPILQTLFLGGCTWSNTKNICISNPALQQLVLSNTVEQEGFQDCALKIDAPSLEYLVYKGNVAKDYDLSSFPSLVQAHIDIFFHVCRTSREKAIDYATVVSKFLQALAHVVYLTISDRTLQVITIADNLWNHLPSYHNLIELRLTQKVTADKALIVLLEKAPNLKLLEFERFVPSFPGEKEDEIGDDGGEDIDYSEDDSGGLEMVSTRLSFPHLKFVNFNKFTGKAWEMKWLKLILKKAKALVSMTFSCDPIWLMRSENVMEHISRLPKASAGCVFMFYPEQG